MEDLAGAHSYTYDALYRLTQVTYPDDQTDSYTYDAAGNRLTKNSDDYTYDDADQLTDVEGVEYAYDDNGNLIGRGNDTFTYDHENRLVESYIGGVSSVYTYNGDGLRVSRTIGQTSVSYIWDVNAGLPVILQDSEGNTYVYGLDLISRTDDEGNQEYYLYDGLGSTTDLQGESGSAVAGYTYDVFGAIRDQSGSSPNEFTFTGEQVDGTGLQYLRARYYEPEIGRFLTQDPFWGSLGNPQSQNRYPYAGGNPVNRIDPSGLSSEGGNFGPSPQPTPWPTPGPYLPPHGPVHLPTDSLLDPLKPCYGAGRWVGGVFIYGCTTPEPRVGPGWGVFRDVGEDVRGRLSAVHGWLTSECGQGFAKLGVGTLAVMAAATGVGALVEGGGIALGSAASAGTSAAAAGAAAGPQNIQNIIMFIPGGVQQVVTGCR